jgi:hypothetical protein
MNRTITFALVLLTACAARAKPVVTGGGGGGDSPTVVRGAGGEAVPMEAQATVPKLVGMTAEEANKAWHAAGFALDVETNGDPDCDGPKVSGKIKCQDPAPGTKANLHAIMSLAIYHEEPRHMIKPDEERSLLGKPVDVVKKQLADWGYKGKISIQSYGTGNAHCTAGQVCEIMPAGGFGLDTDIALAVADELKIKAPPP